MKGSRFLAYLEPCDDRRAAEKRIDELRELHRDASHVCWAWRLLAEPDPGESSSDAGEPSGTAGVPILSALRSGELWNVLGVVVRWFGGTKLGRGGLIRAYREAIEAAISGATLIETERLRPVRVTVPLERVGDVHRVLSAFDVTYLDQHVENDSVRFDLEIRVADRTPMGERITDSTGGTARISDRDPEREGSSE